MSLINLNQLLKTIDRLNKKINDSNKYLKINEESIMVTPVTTEDEFNEFFNLVNQKIIDHNINLDEYFKLFTNHFKLKEILLTENSRIGLDKMMIKLSILSKQISFTDSYVKNNTYITLTNKKLSLDHYKSMFTDEVKYNNVKFSCCSQERLKELEKEVELMKKEKDKLSDEIAKLNQTTFVEVSDDLLE